MKARIESNGKLRFEDVSGSEIRFRNFAGRKDEKYNRNGERSFNLILTDEFAEELSAAGWRVKFGKEKEDGTRYPAALKVKINFESGRPPVISQYTNHNSIQLDGAMAKIVDTAQIESAAFIIAPYTKGNYDGKITPYLENMRYKLEEDPFDGMYEGYDYSVPEESTANEWCARYIPNGRYRV